MLRAGLQPQTSQHPDSNEKIYILLKNYWGFFVRNILVAGRQVVETGLDVLVVIIYLLLVKQGLGVEALQGLSQLQELLSAVLPVPPLVADVLEETKPYKKSYTAHPGRG